jgi:Kelch motif
MVLVAGGSNFDNGILASAELYNPVTGSWTGAGRLNIARWHHTATLLSDGTVLVAGGLSRRNSLTSAEIYDPATGNWTAAASLNNARGLHTATVLSDGRVLVAGGNNNGAFVATAELYESGPASSP